MWEPAAGRRRAGVVDALQVVALLPLGPERPGDPPGPARWRGRNFRRRRPYQCRIRTVPDSTSPTPEPTRRSVWRASRRTFLRALAALLGSGSGFVLPSPVTEARGRSTVWTPRSTLADGYYTAPPQQAAHPFNAVGALWPGHPSAIDR